MNTEGIAVTVNHLSKQFGEFRAVDDISFDVNRGEIFGFLGANGAGKTTTIRMLCGLIQPDQGNATVAGLDLFTAREAIRLKIGYMSQKFSLYSDLTVRENIEFYGGIYGLTRVQIREKISELLAFLGLESQANQLTGSLPLGWKQRLALSTAILHDPEIVFLDEPTSGVDPISRRQFWQLIYDLAKAGKTIFVTTHYMDEAEYCQRLSIMKDGKVIAIGSPTQLKVDYQVATIQDVFLSIVGLNKGNT